MKKFFSILATALAICCICFAFAGCGVNQNAADQINEAANAGEHMTYEEVTKKYGDPTYKVGLDLGDFGVNGVYVWVNGCDSYEEVKAKWDEGKTVKALSVTFAGGKATAATYSENYKE